MNVYQLKIEERQRVVATVVIFGKQSDRLKVLRGAQCLFEDPEPL